MKKEFRRWEMGDRREAGTPLPFGRGEGERYRSARFMRGRVAFTLIELLVVIAIIALLAAMLIPVGSAVNRTKMKKLAEASKSLMQSAIETYHSKIGVYPAADTNNPALNPLFYELCGTTFDEATKTYTTKDGSAKIQDTDVPLTFGPGIGGFANSSKSAVGDEGRPAENFLKAGVKAGQNYISITNPSNNAMQITIMGVPIDGTNAATSADGKKFTAWCYNASTPTNNPKTYDLWIDLKIGSDTWRINNWGQPQKLN